MVVFFEGALLPSTGAGRAETLPRTHPETPNSGKGTRRGAAGLSTKHIDSTNRRYHKRTGHNRTPTRRPNKAPKIIARFRLKANRSTHGLRSRTGRSRPSSRGETTILPEELGKDITGRMDTGNNVRMQSGIHVSTPSRKRTGFHTTRRGKVPGTRRRVRKAHRKRGHRASLHPLSSNLHQPNVRRPQIGRLVEAGAKPEVTQSICPSKTFQDGVDTDSKRSSTQRGLDGKARPKRCLPFHSDARHPSTISGLPLERTTLAVQDTALRPEQCSLHIHQADEAGYSDPEETGDKGDPIPRRPIDHGPIKEGNKATPSNSVRAHNSTGLHHQHKEKCNRPSSGDRVSGVRAEFGGHDHFPTTTETEIPEESSKATEGPRIRNGQTDSPATRHDGGSPSSHSASTITLPESGESEVENGSDGSFLRVPNTGGPRYGHGAAVVDRQRKPPQWKTPTDHTVGLDNRDRRIHNGMGCIQSGGENRRRMDPGGETASHQLSRASSRVTCTKDLCVQGEGSQHPPSGGQCDCNRLPQQTGRDSFPGTVRSCCEYMELVSTERDYNPCRASSRKGECQSGLGVTPCEGLQRLDAQERPLHPTGRQVGTVFYRSVCVSDKHTSGDVLQLAPGPSSPGGGCLVHPLVRSPGIHVPTFCPDHPVPGETAFGTSECSANCPCVAESAVVPSAPPKLSRLPNSTSSMPGHNTRTGWSEPPDGSTRTPPSGRLAHLRESFNASGLSDGVVDLLKKSWRASTESAYSAAWRKWECWCLSRGTDPLSAPLKDVLEFLLLEFEAGKQYRTINTTRSAISMTHTEVDGVRIGQHPLVTRMLKGIFNSRPPKPRYTSTWDVDFVLSYYESSPENSQLSLQTLAHKVAMLFALANADRCSDLAALDLNHRTYQVNGVKFIIPGLTKSRRRGPPIEAFYPSFPESPKLCPVQALREYEKRSEKLRQTESENPLFISVRKPYAPVKTCTIGNWLKRVMSASGVDTSIFTAHSTRGAATSKAKAVGVSTVDILKAANWSSESTFRRFYHRPVTSSEFGRRVLKSSDTK